MTVTRRANDQPPVEMMVSDEPCLDVEEQMVVDSEVLVHGGDLIQPPYSDTGLIVPLSSPVVPRGSVVQPAGDRQSVAVVDPGTAKALVWTYGRPAFYVSPAAVLANVPTAVVAPIKRETPDTVPAPSTSHQHGSAEPHPLPGSAVEQSVSSAEVQPSKAHLPPFETFRAPAISGGSSSMTSSTCDAMSPPVVNLCLAIRSTTKSELLLVTEPLPLTSSLYGGHPVTSSSAAAPLPFPVWSLPTAPPSSADFGTQLLRTSDRDRLVLSTPLKADDGHVTEQLLSVQKAPPTTAVEALPSTCVSNDGGVCH